ncbi:DUF6188 family protein [Pseudarthrobacter chlorophenolicus]|uniref:DUF6188 family protein n=1 Tax=Pseudarthrobacter chlorophenolicus TaxID=85085 RepID=UPI000696D06B|nr:DUF6188 family protein [Pseudarthrobacter chlorophenolicus]
MSGAKRFEGYWLLEVSGQLILQLVLDFQVALVLEQFRITIEESFVLEHPDGTSHVVEPGGGFDQLSPVLPLSRSQVVAEARAFDDGRLEIVTQDGFRLRVVPEPKSAYEAWNVTGPNGLLIVSTPAGELSLWDGP